jgi:nucleoside-diphosphate-sugar epimerase
VKVLVMGGTRLMGDASVRHLLAAGHEVTVFNRGSREPDWAERVAQLRGDRDVPADLAQIAELDLDAVVDFSAYRGAQSESLVGVLPAGVHLVHCSTGAVYAPVPQLPWAEDSPIGPWELWGEYAREKLATERAVRVAATADRAVTIFRLPYVLGPRNYAPREEFVLNRLLDGADVLLPGDGKAVQHFVTAEQVGESVALLVTHRPDSEIAVYNIADRRGLCTTEGFVQLCADVAGVEPRTRPVPGPTGADGPFSAADCVFPFPNEAYVMDVSRAAAAGVLPAPRPLAAAIELALDALRADPERRRWQRTGAEQAALRVAS